MGSVTGRPLTVICPVELFKRPATISINVLLPHPEAPTTEMNSPSVIVTSMGLSARKGVSPSSPKIFETALIVIGTPDLRAAGEGGVTWLISGCSPILQGVGNKIS